MKVPNKAVLVVVVLFLCLLMMKLKFLCLIEVDGMIVRERGFVTKKADAEVKFIIQSTNVVVFINIQNIFISMGKQKQSSGVKVE